MENVSHVLIIVVSVLIAIVIIFLIIFVFGHLSQLPEAQQDTLRSENIKKFNESFTAYDKDLMYGADVLSCLNKAESNNQKYVNNNYYGIDSPGVTAEQRKEYLIDVKVKLKTTVQEQIIVNCKDENGNIIREQTKEYNYKPFADKANPKFKIPNVVYYYFSTSGNIMKQKTEDYESMIWAENLKSKKLKSGTYDTKLVGGREYSILSDETGQLSALLSTVTLVEQTIYHDNYNGGGNSNWYSATWRTAAYDFKTKKFKCTDVQYGETTGYVNLICFEELD